MWCCTDLLCIYQSEMNPNALELLVFVEHCSALHMAVTVGCIALVENTRAWIEPVIQKS